MVLPTVGGEKGSRCGRNPYSGAAPATVSDEPSPQPLVNPGRRERQRPASQETCHQTLCFGGVWAGCTGRDFALTAVAPAQTAQTRDPRGPGPERRVEEVCFS